MTLIDEKLRLKDHESARLIEKISPLAIRHIILGGIYNYEDNDGKIIDVSNIIAAFNEAWGKLITQKMQEKK